MNPQHHRPHTNFSNRTKGQTFERRHRVYNRTTDKGIFHQNSEVETIPNSNQETSSSTSSQSTYPSTKQIHCRSQKDYDRDQEPSSHRTIENGSSRNFYPRSQKNLNNGMQVPPKHMTKNESETRTIGTIVNGRYVRKSSVSSQASSNKLNVDAPPFFPKTDGAYKADSQISHGTKPKYREDFNRNFYHNRTSKFNQGYYRNEPDFHGFNQNVHGRSSHFKNRQNANRKKSVDKDITVFEKDVKVEAFDSEDESFDVKMNIGKNLYTSKVHTSKESITQRERLVLQLEKSECECLVCCESVRIRDYVWSCGNCYHVFHLKCIKKWARSQTAVNKDSGWRCPTCQNVTEEVPSAYYCFCGKRKDPEVNPHFTPHTCGEICGKQREDEQCIHHCNLLCHPGPCPPCTATINKACQCGKTFKTMPCARSDPFTCLGQCDKLLNCGIHHCQAYCHTDDCLPCSVTLTQRCHCDSEKKEVTCNSVTAKQSSYSCGSQCGMRVSCGNHLCLLICHPGPCESCKLLPELVTSCPCGKTLLEDMHLADKRLSCIDPIPVCGELCGKVLSCGPKGNPHKCSLNCHTGDCLPCNLTTMIKCQCGLTSKEVPCKEMMDSSFSFRCEKRCNRRKDCGRHKCLNHCCNNILHHCELVCNKKLTCGLHHCQETCHAGNCHTCWNVSFDELTCHCGYSIRYPPIPCGSKPPECTKPCIRIHPCNHQVQHSCHSEDKCPPCTALTVKWCFGHHEKRPSVQCFVDGISCGKPCDKPSPCDRHRCLEICHRGPCLKPGIKCTQPCATLRTCGHPCAATCHDGQCPNTVCKAKVDVSCPCGHRNEVTTCSEITGTFHMMSVGILASKIQDIKAGESVSISEIFSRKGKTNRLQCNEECAVIERNKRLALALQIQNPDLSCKPGAPNYSEFLKDEAKKNLKFVSGVYDKFCELVQLSKQSKQKSRSYSFPPMNRDHRRVIHELAEFFGCDSQSYDEEPVKNVVITAHREKSWLPFVSIVAVAERDMGIRRCPPPVTHVPTKGLTTPVTSSEKKEKPIDYFDYTGM